MDFQKLSYPVASLIKVLSPSPRSKEFLDYQLTHEGSAVSYPKGMSTAVRRGKGATVEDMNQERGRG